MFASIFTLCIQTLDKEIESITHSKVIIRHKLPITNINTVILPIKKINYSTDQDIKERQGLVVEQCKLFGADHDLALRIIPCEGGFSNPERCNDWLGCGGGQGHYQFIKSTWFSTQERMGDILPEKCREGDIRGDSDCNIIAGTWLLATDGDGHWRTWSGSCYMR